MKSAFCTVKQTKVGRKLVKLLEKWARLSYKIYSILHGTNKFQKISKKKVAKFHKLTDKIDRLSEELGYVPLKNEFYESHWYDVVINPRLLFDYPQGPYLMLEAIFTEFSRDPLRKDAPLPFRGTGGTQLFTGRERKETEEPYLASMAKMSVGSLLLLQRFELVYEAAQSARGFTEDNCFETKLVEGENDYSPHSLYGEDKFDDGVAPRPRA